MRQQSVLPEEVIGDLTTKYKVPSIQPTIPPPNLGDAPSPIVGETLSKSLDDAANTLISLLTPSLKEYIIELSDMVLKIPRWQLVLGSIMAQYESGQLASPSLDPSWRQVEAIIGMSICGYSKCKKEFTPKRVGQVYCSTTCGDAVRKELILKNQAERRKIDEANDARLQQIYLKRVGKALLKAENEDEDEN